MPSQQDISLETCLICCLNIPSVVLMPCKHAGICLKCVEDLANRPDFLCHLCRKPVTHIAKIIKTNEKLSQIIGISKVSWETII